MDNDIMTDEAGTDAAGRYILFGDHPIEEELFARVAADDGSGAAAAPVPVPVIDFNPMLGAAGEEFVYVTGDAEPTLGTTYAHDMFNDSNFDVNLILLQAETHSHSPGDGSLVDFGEMADDQINLDHLFDAMELAKSALPDPLVHMTPDLPAGADPVAAFTGADHDAGTETAYLTAPVDLGVTIDRLFEHIAGGDQS